MATINAIGSNKPIPVSFGGTGDASLSAFQVLAGGTTATNPVQVITGTGSAGQILTSNGAGALPTWQTGAGGTVPNYTAPTAYTPALSFGGASTGITYLIQTGSYMVIGQLCFFVFDVSPNSLGSSTGNAGVSLPVAPITGTSSFTLGYINAVGFQSLPASGAMGFLIQSGSSIGIIEAFDTGTQSNVALTKSNFLAATTRILLSGCYMIN